MKLSHTSIVVPDLDRAVKTMQEVYGLACGKISENRQQGVRLTYIDFGNSICVDDDGSGAGLDSLVVSTTRIQMGKRVAGGSCNSDDIRTM